MIRALVTAFALLGAGVFSALAVLKSGDEQYMMAVIAILYYAGIVYSFTIDNGGEYR